MALLDQVLGGLMGGNSGSPLQGILMNMLGGGGQQQGYNQQQGYGQQPTNQPGFNQGGFGGGGGGLAGGIGGLLSAFQQAGLGHIAQSWVSQGPNQPVSPEQLQNVFGHDRVQDMANQAGMPQQDFLSQLSQHLPRAVDGVTPNGRLPDEGTVSV